MKNTTDGTERLLFISRLVHEGGEPELKDAIERNFPAEAFERVGLVGFTAHVGAGYCVLEFGFEGPFDPIFEGLAEDDEASRFLDLLGRHVDPPPRIDPDHTADLPLAADQFLWRVETGTASRRPSGGHSGRAKGNGNGAASKRPASDVNRGGTRSSSRSAAATGGGVAKGRPAVETPKSSASRTKRKSQGAGNGGRRGASRSAR